MPTGEPISKQKVLEALTRKFVLDDDVDILRVAEACPATFTGADVYALCSDAWMGAFRRIALGGDDGTRTVEPGKELPEIVVKQEDFLHSLLTLQPSLSEEEIRKYERLRESYEAQAGW